jgi:LPXTG-motif cell wall-anchored protein
MKKTFVLLGASALGVIGAGVVAMPAQAVEPALAACDSVDEHFVDQPTEQWYTDCVPQFGAGKVEFSIDTEDAPEGFVPLTDESVTVTTDLDTEAAADYGLGEYEYGAFTVLDAPDDDQGDQDEQEEQEDAATTQRYYGIITAPITGVAGVDLASLPEECDADYETAYVVTYAPVTTTFTQTVAGEEWRYDVTATPVPKTIAFSVNDEGFFDQGEPLCISDGTTTEALDGQGPGSEYAALTQIQGGGESDVYVTLAPFVEPLSSEEPGLADLGTFARYVAPVVEQPVTQPAADDDAEELAETGADASPALIGAGGLLAAGLAALVFRARRRENATR